MILVALLLAAVRYAWQAQMFTQFLGMAAFQTHQLRIFRLRRIRPRTEEAEMKDAA